MELSSTSRTGISFDFEEKTDNPAETDETEELRKRAGNVAEREKITRSEIQRRA